MWLSRRGGQATLTADRAVKSRRRGEVLRVAILEAAWAELREHAWSGFHMDRVAERAGTGKAALYRRWPNRAALVRDASLWMAASSARAWESTGDLRGDLVRFLDNTARFIDGPFGESVRGLVAEPPGEGPGSLRTGEPLGIVTTILEDARRSGALGAREPERAVLNLGSFLVTAEYLASGRAPDLESVTEIVDCLWLPALRAACSDG